MKVKLLSRLCKQKIVIKICASDSKCRSKAMKIAAVAEAVSSVALQGVDRDQLVVTGDGVDSVSLTNSLRKKLCSAILVSVEEVKDKKKEDEKKKLEFWCRLCHQHPCVCYPMVMNPYPYPPSCCKLVYNSDPTCSIQ